MAEPHNTPMPASTPVPASAPPSSSPSPPLPSLTSNASMMTIPLRPPQQDPSIKRRPMFSQAFEVIRPSTAERGRSEFENALQEQRWGDFSAIFRPFWGTGGEMGRFDWADTKLLGERGIIYWNSGLAAAEAVADFAVAMVISTFRHLPWCMGAATIPYFLSASSFPDATTASMASTAGKTFQTCHLLAPAVSHNPRNHVLGLVGFGNIGQQIAAKLGPSFGMRIAYHDVVRKPASLESSLGATFVNVARGNLVSEEALADALEDGRISAAALGVHGEGPRFSPRMVKMALGERDLYERSPQADERPNFDHPGRVMLTCHNAGGTVETHIGFEELSMRNIMAVLGGQEAITPVNMHYLKATE
ncbi:hypothetical protein QBC32DRAFT_372060 [Pseudoneurospora amorphoporcata]|uniref:D-isomer specific 2-hydroxyacid dehydrogenase NAD-binding domain-containing protein n=1 Tax=Pseudoneurospora amorphoporcata TaxID=241081 RepID=A0AAN6SE63_9PEZI|nr:hypothetical protein QBC32DRAFT_372060 [Pseudoneurospora amorphoporcata]